MIICRPIGWDRFRFGFQSNKRLAVTKQLWELDQEELAERCALAEFEIDRLRAALKLIDDYYQSGGDLMSHVSHIAQEALNKSMQE